MQFTGGLLISYDHVRCNIINNAALRGMFSREGECTEPWFNLKKINSLWTAETRFMTQHPVNFRLITEAKTIVSQRCWRDIQRDDACLWKVIMEKHARVSLFWLLNSWKSGSRHVFVCLFFHLPCLKFTHVNDLMLEWERENQEM
jgi:hypothetical protein